MWRTTAVAALCSGLALLPGCGRTATRTPAAAAPAAAPAAGDTRGHNQTGAVDSLPASTLESRHVEDIAELLQGRVAGLQVIRLPNGDVSLRIRGGDVSLDSASADGGEPLLVIDGMPVAEPNLSGALKSLDPHEIANIEVLKDVSSTSVYGIRGAHGVILITMKHD